MRLYLVVVIDFVLVCEVVSVINVRLWGLLVVLQVLAPLPIGFAVFMVHLATIPITGTGINPARSFGAAVIFNRSKPWDDHVSLVAVLFS